MHLKNPSFLCDYVKAAHVDLGKYKILSKNYRKLYNLFQSLTEH